MSTTGRVQIHQYNDPEILEFFNEHQVQYRLLGDHLFILRSRGRDVAAGPGDWLSTAPDGAVEVHRGDYARRARRAVLRAKRARTPESDTDGCKHRLEAEARDRMTHKIRHVAPNRGSRR